MTDVEASVRDLVSRDRDCAGRALHQMGLRRNLALLIAEWKAAGGGDVLPNIRDVRLRPAKKDGKPMRTTSRR